MRQPKESDFFITVPDVGGFRFGRRTYGDKAKIRIEFSRYMREMTDDDRLADDDGLIGQVAVMAAYKVLCVDCPPGWESLEGLDMAGDDAVEEKINALFVLLNEKEDSFRSKAESGSEASGA